MSAFSLFLCSLVMGNTWVVDPGGGGDFLTIQDAIDASAAGDLIQITPATYEEDLLVHVAVTLEGLGGGSVVIHPATSNRGSGFGSQVLTTTQSCVIRAHDVTLRDLVFDGDNPSLGGGIDVRSGIITDYTSGPWDRLTVENCEVRNIHLRAIYGSTGNGHLFQGNQVSNAKGMYLESSGLMLWGANGVIRDNEVRDCSLGITNHAGSNGDIYSNQVFDCDLGVLTNGTNAATAVYDNHFEDCSQGHQLIGTNADVTLRNNVYLRSDWGVSFFGSNGQGLIEDNLIDGEGMPTAVGVFATTDLAPWGVNDVLGHLQRNAFRGLRNGVVLDETAASAAKTVGLVLGGGPADANSFRQIENLNLKLAGCNDDVDARFNSWGVATSAAIELSILHQVDDPALGLVDFTDAVADQVVVDAAGGGDYLTIQEGIDNVDSGGTVVVRPGDYVASLVVDKSLSLEGSGADSNPLIGTRIFGDNASAGVGNDVISVLADGVGIQDVWVYAWSTIHDDRYGAGVAFLDANNGEVRNVVVHRGVFGLYAFSSDGLLIENCTVFDCGVSSTLGGGIVYSESSGTLGSPGAGNSALNSDSIGFLATQASSISAYDNLAENCEVGFAVYQAAAPTLLQGNGAISCDRGFQANANNAAVDLVDNNAKSGATTFAGIALYGGGTGIYSLTGNSTDGSGAALIGFYMNPNGAFGSSDLHANLSDNNILNARYGLFLDEAVGNSFVLDMNAVGTGGNHNRIAGHVVYSVYLQNCNDNVPMTENYWGTQDPSLIADWIYDSEDVAGLGTVDFTNPLPPTPDLRVDAVHRALGYPAQVVVTGNPGDVFRIGVSRTTGTWVTPYGTLGIPENGTQVILKDSIPSSGVFSTRLDALRGAPGVFYIQGVVFDSINAITDLETITLREVPE